VAYRWLKRLPHLESIQPSLQLELVLLMLMQGRSSLERPSPVRVLMWNRFGLMAQDHQSLADCYPPPLQALV